MHMNNFDELWNISAVLIEVLNNLIKVFNAKESNETSFFPLS